MTSTIQRLVVGTVLSGTLLGVACQKTPAEARTDGVEADEKISAAHEKAAEANREAAAVHEDARKTSAEAQANANEKMRDTNRAAVGDQDSARNWGQKQIDSVDNMIDAAGVKAQTAAPTAKATFQSEIAGVKQDRDKLHGDLATLDVPPGDKLDKNKAQFSERVDRIKDDIRTIEKTL